MCIRDRCGFALRGHRGWSGEMTDAKLEVRHAVYTLLTTLELFRETDPTAVINDAADDFNLILFTAKRAFPDSAMVQALRPLDPDTPLITLVTRVATLRGAVESQR